MKIKVVKEMKWNEDKKPERIRGYQEIRVVTTDGPYNRPYNQRKEDKPCRKIKIQQSGGVSDAHCLGTCCRISVRKHLHFTRHNNHRFDVMNEAR